VLSLDDTTLRNRLDVVQSRWLWLDAEPQSAATQKALTVFRQGGVPASGKLNEKKRAELESVRASCNALMWWPSDGAYV
jgi:hypothetical protein